MSNRVQIVQCLSWVREGGSDSSDWSRRTSPRVEPFAVDVRCRRVPRQELRTEGKREVWVRQSFRTVEREDLFKSQVSEEWWRSHRRPDLVVVDSDSTNMIIGVRCGTKVGRRDSWIIDCSRKSGTRGLEKVRMGLILGFQEEYRTCRTRSTRGLRRD